MRAAAIRPWCARARYPGLEPFVAGHIAMPADAQHHEIEAALREHLATFLPGGFEIEGAICGALFFQAEDDDRAEYGNALDPPPSADRHVRDERPQKD